ncbi:MAG TPA: hypothetical protein VN692_10965 [Steroidobacteraceae bacterium]|nr:hypothetical protein [Steroidobacteraceae bacterium]
MLLAQTAVVEGCCTRSRHLGEDLGLVAGDGHADVSIQSHKQFVATRGGADVALFFTASGASAPRPQPHPAGRNRQTHCRNCTRSLQRFCVTGPYCASYSVFAAFDPRSIKSTSVLAARTPELDAIETQLHQS